MKSKIHISSEERWDRNEVIKTPSNTLLEFLRKSDQSEIAINIKEVGMKALKLLLLELYIREAKWIGKHPNSLKLQRVQIAELEQTFDYGFKDITTLEYFNQVFD